MCLSLSSISTGLVHADGCTPDLETGICVTTDKTTYNPGDTVIATVEVTVPPNTPSVTISIAIYPVPPSPCSLTCATWGNVTLSPDSGAAGVWSGTVGIRLPNHETAGNYEVEAFGPSWAPYAGARITITSQTPVPETPSVLALLLPALLLGTYASRRKNGRTEVAAVLGRQARSSNGEAETNPGACLITEVRRSYDP